MATSAVGKSFSPRKRVITRDDVDAFIDATGDRHRDGLAPPMIVTVASIIDGVAPTALLPEVIGDPARLLRLVHGEEDITWSALVRAGDELTTVAAVEGSEEKSSGELLTIGTRVSNQRGELVAVTRSSLMIRDRKPTSLRAMKDEITRREPPPEATFSQTWPVSLDQPDRYARASGDHNPIHLDNAVARSAGLRGRVLHGMCTMAFAQRTIIECLANGDVGRVERLRVRFTKPVYPGDTLTCAGWQLEPQRYGFEVRNHDGQVVLREASAWLR